MSLALQGYQPFRVEDGIYCGGFQGPLYPNPTTLSAPSILFDPYQYTGFIASVYDPSDYYSGLGVGDPGIDYKNPGHVLGIFDTFARMSYGINILNFIHDGEDADGSIDQAVNVRLPLVDVEYNSSPITVGDIYPSLFEAPAGWIDAFEVKDNGKVTSMTYKPPANLIDEVALNGLFADKSVFSYFGMPAYFRNIIDGLSTAAQGLSTQSDNEFTVSSLSNLNVYAGGLFYPDTGEGGEQQYAELTETGVIHHKCEVSSPAKALKILTGDTSYHNGIMEEDTVNEYRSLTELNSVVNIVPVQTIGMSHNVVLHVPLISYPPGGEMVITYPETSARFFYVFSYINSDLAINVSDIPSEPGGSAGTVSIEGTLTMKHMVGDADPMIRTITVGEYTFDLAPYQSFNRFGYIKMALDNQYSWDRGWLGVGDNSDSYSTSDGNDQIIGPYSEVEELDTSDFVIPFSNTFTLTPGCNNIMMRVRGRSRERVMPGDLPGGLWWFHVNTDYGNGNPDEMPAELAPINMILSFTVTGSSFSPISHTMSF